MTVRVFAHVPQGDLAAPVRGFYTAEFDGPEAVTVNRLEQALQEARSGGGRPSVIIANEDIARLSPEVRNRLHLDGSQ